MAKNYCHKNIDKRHNAGDLHDFKCFKVTNDLNKQTFFNNKNDCSNKTIHILSTTQAGLFLCSKTP